MRDCWNCGSAQAEHHRYCAVCGQALAPSPEDRERLAFALTYLVRETGRWPWLPPAERERVRAEYSRRQERLQGAGGPTAPAPGRPELRPSRTAPPPPPGTPGSRPGVAPLQRPTALPQSPAPGQGRPSGPQPVGVCPPEVRRLAASEVAGVALDPARPGALGPAARLSAFLEEANIRWLHLLGGLLLASAGVGLLYSQWNAHGRQVVALALLLAPILCFAAAVRLRQALPVSSRLLAMVGGLLLPTGLVAARLFELAGLVVPWPPWNLFSFISSGLVLLALSLVLEEAACLYLGAFALAAAAGSLAAWTNHPPAFGLACLAISAAGLAAARSGTLRPERFRPHLFGLSQALAGLGLLSTLPSFLRTSGGAPLADLSLLLLGATFFASAGFLTGRRGAVLGSAPAAMAALVLYGITGDQPPLSLGYGIVALGSLYAVAGRAMREQPGMRQAADASFFVGTVLMAVPLVLLLGGHLLLGLVDNFATLPIDELRTGILVGVLAALLYAAGAATCSAPRLMYAASASLAYAWFLGSVLMHRALPGLYSLDLSLLPLAWVVLAWALRRVLPESLLTPVVESALVLTCLPAPLSLALGALEVPAAAGAAPETVLITAVTLLAATPWFQAGRLLYPAVGWGALAYALWLPRLLEAAGLPAREPNHGFAFLPLLAVLAAAAVSLRRRAGEAYANPVARVTLLVACGLATWQLAPIGDRRLAAVTLGLYAAGFAGFTLPFRTWRFLDVSASELLARLATFALAAALWVGGGDGGAASHAALLAFSVVAWLAASAPPVPDFARTPLRHAALLVGPVVTFLGPGVRDASLGLRTAFAYGPALLWLLRAFSQARPETTVAGSAGLALTGVFVLWSHGGPPLGHSAPGLAAMAALAAGHGLLGLRDRPAAALLLAWLFAGATWDGALHLQGLDGDARVRLWWVFWLLLCGAVAERRPRSPVGGRLLEAAAILSTCLLLGRATVASSPVFLQTNLLVAGSLLLVGWRRPQPLWLFLGWALVAMVPLQAEWTVLADGPLPGRAGMVLAAIVAMLALLGPVARRRNHPMAWTLAPAARLTALGATLLALSDPSPARTSGALAGVATALWIQAGLRPSRLDCHLGFAAAWLAYAVQLSQAGIGTGEIWLAPPAAWLLFWGERYRAEGARALADGLAGAGALLLVAPALLATAKATAVGHLLFLVVVALALLLVGVGRRHRVYATAGSLALLAEIVLQALRLAVMVPWWYVALASGLLLVSLGILFERRRMELLRAGQNLLQEVSRW